MCAAHASLSVPVGLRHLYACSGSSIDAILLTVSETTASALSNLDALAVEAWTLEPVPPHERKGLLRDEAALLLDGLLVRFARGRGALDVALGEGLAALSVGDRVLRLGFSCLGDYARERLGIAGSTAQKLARLARELAGRPRLRFAVHAGELSARKAETILPVARGDDEEVWVIRARGETVRALAAAVKASRGSEPEADEPWERVTLPVGTDAKEALDEAMALAGKLLGAAAPKWQRLEAICEEFLGAHPEPALPKGEVASPQLDHQPVIEKLEAAKTWLEEETRNWSFLDAFEPVPASIDAELDAAGVAHLDAELRRLAGMRRRWDDLVGHLALLVRSCGLWRDLQFASFGHYCTERLGLSERAVGQRVALERRLYELPALRSAMRDGRLSYEKARIVASCADDQTVDAWVTLAQGLTCIALAREVESFDEAQMCARGEVSLRLPVHVVSLLDSAMRAAQRAAGRWLRPDEPLQLIAQHFIDTWKPLLATRNTVQKRVLARDRGLCQVPGCSRAALQIHHVTFRSHGGSDASENLVSLCAAHHLHGVHVGWVRVSGLAPGRLRWRFRERAGPMMSVVSLRASPEA
jgi:hypothetical protein